MRIFPSALTDLAFSRFENSYNERVVVYLHPWEIDPEQPRIQSPLKSRLRHYTNLARMSAKVDAVLSRYKFERFSDVMAAEAHEALPHTVGITNPEEIADHAQVVAQGRGNR